VTKPTSSPAVVLPTATARASQATRAPTAPNTSPWATGVGRAAQRTRRTSARSTATSSGSKRRPRSRRPRRPAASRGAARAPAGARRPLDRALVGSGGGLDRTADRAGGHDRRQHQQQQAGGRDRVGRRQHGEDGDERGGLRDERSEPVQHVRLDLAQVAEDAGRQPPAGGVAGGARRAPQQRVVEPRPPHARPVGGRLAERHVLQVEQRGPGHHHRRAHGQPARQLVEGAGRQHAVEHRRHEQRHQRHPQRGTADGGGDPHAGPHPVGPQQGGVAAGPHAAGLRSPRPAAAGAPPADRPRPAPASSPAAAPGASGGRRRRRAGREPRRDRGRVDEARDLVHQGLAREAVRQRDGDPQPVDEQPDGATLQGDADDRQQREPVPGPVQRDDLGPVERQDHDGGYPGDAEFEGVGAGDRQRHVGGAHVGVAVDLVDHLDAGAGRRHDDVALAAARDPAERGALHAVDAVPQRGLAERAGTGHTKRAWG
jgi:hypothetical protein